MARAYRLEIDLENGQKLLYESGRTGLHVEFDINVVKPTVLATPAIIRVYGVSAQDVRNTPLLVGSKIRFYAGFTKDFPLSDLSGQGLVKIVDSKIYNSFGNWQGTERYLTFVCISSEESLRTGKTGSLKFRKGEPWSTAIQQAFKACLPDYEFKADLEEDPKADKDSLQSFAGAYDLKNKIEAIGKDYFEKKNKLLFVDCDQFKITVSDKIEAETKTIKDAEIIGLPSFERIASLQLLTVLRPDLKLRDKISVNVGIVSIGAENLTSLNNIDPTGKGQTGYDLRGEFLVIGVKHTGKLYDERAESWATSVDAIPVVDGKILYKDEVSARIVP